MKTIVVTEIDLENSKHICYHFFELPLPGERGFYRATMSYNGFFYSLGQWNWTKTRLFYGRRFTEAEEKNSMFDGVPRKQHKDIWDFYKAIGYDYKRKRYVTPERPPADQTTGGN